MKKVFKYIFDVTLTLILINGVFGGVACAWILLGLPVETWALWVVYVISLALIFIIYKLMGLYPTDTDETVDKIFYDIDGAILHFFIENHYDYQLDHSINEIKKKYLPGGDRNEGEG